MAKATSQEVDGSEESYHKLKEWFVAARTSSYMAIQTAKNVLKSTSGPTTSVRGLQEALASMLESKREEIIATEQVLLWAKLALDRRDEENRQNLQTILAFVKKYTPVLEEVEKDYKDKLGRIGKLGG